MRPSPLWAVWVLAVAGCVSPGPAPAAKPAWVATRPAAPDDHVGIGVAGRAGAPSDYRKAALDRALADLAASIAVDVSATFIYNVRERTGMTEEEVRSEIATAAKAHLAGYRVVGDWEDRRQYWVQVRMDRGEYRRQERERELTAARSAADSLARAGAHAAAGRHAAALGAYVAALAALQDHMGKALTVPVGGREVVLVNEIDQGLRALLASLALAPARTCVPFLPGQAPPPLGVRAALREGGRPVPDLPMRFEPAGAGRAIPVQTDLRGVAECRLAAGDVPAQTTPVRVCLDLTKLYEKEQTRAALERIVARLPVPETSLTLNALRDPADFAWRAEFECVPAVVHAAWKLDGAAAPWPRMQDAAIGMLKGAGAAVRPGKTADRPDVVVRASETPEGAWTLEDERGVGLEVVMAASGTVTQRQSAAGAPEFRFSGEIRTAVQRDGRPRVSDRYTVTGGWTPVSRELCLDLLALKAFERFQARYRAALGAGE